MRLWPHSRKRGGRNLKGDRGSLVISLGTSDILSPLAGIDHSTERIYCSFGSGFQPIYSG